MIAHIRRTFAFEVCINYQPSTTEIKVQESWNFIQYALTIHTVTSYLISHWNLRKNKETYSIFK